MKFFILALVFFFINISCATKSFVLNQTEVVSFYFDRKIKRMDNQTNLDLDEIRSIIQTKIEYAYGILMEEGDMLLDNDYSKSLKYYHKANEIFRDAQSTSINLLGDRYPQFEQWLKDDYEISFKKNDVIDLYWLAAAIGGTIKSSRGTDPFVLIHIPNIGRLLKTAIQLDPDWGNGKLYTAMMSYTSVRPDLNGENLDDTLNFYYERALQYSDSLDASIFVSYAESVHKPNQEKREYMEKLDFVIEMEIEKGSENEINNIISKKRAKWLLSKTEDYFLE